MMQHKWLWISALAFLAAATDLAPAQTYPSTQIKIYVGFPPGGTTDIIARDIGIELEKALQQKIGRAHV